MISYEWGTRLPGGNVCKWDGEQQARAAHEVSLTFPDGAHPLVYRAVGSWTEAAQCPGDCPGDCAKCVSGKWALMCDDCRSYAAMNAEIDPSAVKP